MHLLFIQVASRQVLICAGILYIVFGILGKVSAVFITIPYPVLGGAALVMFSTFLGVVLSNLQVSTRIFYTGVMEKGTFQHINCP